MSEEGKIRASDLLEEKALLVFKELEQITRDNIKSITELSETTRRLSRVTMKSASDSVMLQQTIKDNLKEIDRLRRQMIDTELKYISITDRAASKRKSVEDAKKAAAKKEAADIKKIADAKEKAAKKEEDEQRKILALRTKFAKEAIAKDNEKAKIFIANAKKEANAVVTAEKRKRSARKAAITALSTSYLAVAQIARTVVAGWNKVVNTLITLDNFSNLMKRLTGTTSAAANSMEYLIGISRKFGLDLATATERFSKFYAAAKQSNLTMVETRKIFTSVAKVSGILGLRSHELSGVFLALEQMLSKGKVTTEELRRQLGERLPGAFGIMAKAVDVLNPKMVVTVQNLDELLKKGLIISRDVMPEFAKQLEIAFNTINIDRVETLAAAQTRFGTSITQLVYIMENGQGAISSFFRGIYDGLTMQVDALGEYITLLDATNEELTKLGLLEKSARNATQVAFIWGDIAGANDRAKELTKEYKKYKKELIDGIKYNAMHKLLLKDMVDLTYANGLNIRKLGDYEDELAIKLALRKKFENATNESLEQQLLNLQAINKEKAIAAKFEINTIAWLDYQIKKEKDILTKRGTFVNLGEDEIRNAKVRLVALEKYRKKLAIVLGLDKERAKTKKNKISDGPLYDWVDNIKQAAEDSIDFYKEGISGIESALNAMNAEELKRAVTLKEQLATYKEQLAILEKSKVLVDEIADSEDGFLPGVASGAEYRTQTHTAGDAVSRIGKGSSSSLIDKWAEDFKAMDETTRGTWEKFLNGKKKEVDDVVLASVELTNQMFEIGNAIFNRRIENINAEIDATERLYDRKIELAQNDKEKQDDLEKEKQAKVDALEKKRLKEQQKQAKLAKAQALFNAGINTAVAVASMLTAGPGVGFVMAALAAAIGLAEVATIAATPIPQYAEGREDGPAEWALTGDGGKHEYIVGKRGIAKTPAKPTLTYLQQGDSVLKDDIALQHFISKTLLKDTGISFLPRDNKGVEEAVANGLKKAKINNFINMPSIKIDLDHMLWLHKNSQF